MANAVLESKRQLKPGAKPRWELGSADAERKLKAEADEREAKAAKAILDLAIQRGEYVQTAEVEERETMLAAYFKRWALALEKDLPARLVGLSEKEMQTVIRKQVRDHLTRMGKM